MATQGLLRPLCSCVSAKKLTLPSRDRKHFDGSTTGDLITNVKMPSGAEEWQLDWKTKKELVGKKHQILVVARLNIRMKRSQRTERATRRSQCPSTAHPWSFTKSCSIVFCAKIVFDLTLLDARFAYAALRNRIEYVGMAYNRGTQPPLFSAPPTVKLRGSRQQQRLGLRHRLSPSPSQNRRRRAKEKQKQSRSARVRAKQNQSQRLCQRRKEREHGAQEDEEEEDAIWDPLV